MSGSCPDCSRAKDLFYEVESNENLEYVLSRNLLNTKSTQFSAVGRAMGGARGRWRELIQIKGVLIFLYKVSLEN